MGYDEIWGWLESLRWILNVSFSFLFFRVVFVNKIFFCLELKELQQMYQALLLDVQGIMELQHHLPQPYLEAMMVLPQQTILTGSFSNLKVKTCGRSNTNPTAEEVAQIQVQ